MEKEPSGNNKSMSNGISDVWSTVHSDVEGTKVPFADSVGHETVGWGQGCQADREAYIGNPNHNGEFAPGSTGAPSEAASVLVEARHSVRLESNPEPQPAEATGLVGASREASKDASVRIKSETTVVDSHVECDNTVQAATHATVAAPCHQGNNEPAAVRFGPTGRADGSAAAVPDRRVSEGATGTSVTPERLTSAPMMVVQHRSDSNTSHGSRALRLHSGSAAMSSDAPRSSWAPLDSDITLPALSVAPSSIGDMISGPAPPTIPLSDTNCVSVSSDIRTDDATPPSRMRTSSSVISSRIISSTPLDSDALQQRTRVVEVPVIEEVTRHVHVRRVLERERHIPQIERTEIKKTIDIPRINIVQKTVETPVIHEVVTTVPVKKVVEIPRESYQHIPKLETRMIEKEVDVIGDVIEVPKSFLVENRVIVPRFVDVPVPTVVSQTLQTKFVESDEHAIEVYLREFEPEIIPVNIFLPRPVSRNVAVVGEISHSHQQVDIPLGHYNSLIMKLNTSADAAARAASMMSNAASGTDTTQPSLASGRCRELTGAFDREATATDDEKTAVDPKFWIDHMLVPHPTGGVPLLPSKAELHIVPPVDDDWITTVPSSTTAVSRKVKASRSSPAAAVGVASA